ncbi:MAG: hypothetical protein LBE12_00885 [Planctomycetaceae bacterium]|nr:hypothetical protein [Planctomycetaceae bacterium]
MNRHIIGCICGTAPNNNIAQNCYVVISPPKHIAISNRNFAGIGRANQTGKS